MYQLTAQSVGHSAWQRELTMLTGSLTTGDGEVTHVGGTVFFVPPCLSVVSAVCGLTFRPKSKRPAWRRAGRLRALILRITSPRSI